MLVRFKCDACLPRKITTSTSNGLGNQISMNDPLDELTAGLQKLKVNKSNTTTVTDSGPASNQSSLTIITRGSSGSLVPQSDILELKTCSSKSAITFDWADAYSQLILSQTPNILLCVHFCGEFQEIRQRTLAELETEPLARKARENLGKLRNVLVTIQTMMIEEGEGARASLICRSGGEITVYKREGTETCLPKEALEKFT
jgi:hypothetical protein